MRQGSSDHTTKMQRGEAGYYFRQGEFVYYLDEGTGQLLPLCSKADCLHDRETDRERLESCNAHMHFDEFSNDFSGGMAYYNGYLYCLTDNGFNEETTLYRLSEDGSKKEQVYRWTDVRVEEWIIHRGIFYYAEHTYTYDEEGEIQGLFTLKSLNLTDAVREPKSIYALEEENVYYAGFNWYRAYGNYLYFIVSGGEDEGADGLYPYEKTFIYDIVNDKVTELTYEGMPKEEDIVEFTFWQDRIVFKPIIWDVNDMLGSYLRDGTVYIADLNGLNTEVLIENVPMGYNVISDGRYLYLTNAFMATVGTRRLGLINYDEEKTFWVYDENLELVDSFVLPRGVEVFGYPPLGDEDWMLITYQDDNGGWGVLRFDKSKIGSCNGAEIEFEVIPYN
ncbi:MAG: hypothetical protein K2K87_05230 [Lachnospiraceae bacterium]|nr:hypothetical protein [Lachnospiraceae bacterium]